ncbi:MAG: PucR family transcriptional regulator [Dorea sp.]|nr:PucR family transcriptional regulator [Dorea sp.]
MLPNQVIQKIIQDIKRISGLEASVWNAKGECLAMTSTVTKALGGRVGSFLKGNESQELMEELERELGLFSIYTDDEPGYVLVLQGKGADISVVGKLGVSQMSNLVQAYRERLDRNHFIQNLILDNMLLVDIYSQAKKMRIVNEQRRIVFIVEPKNEGENLILETLQGLFASGNRDFVTAVDETHVILVKELADGEDYPEVLHMAKVIVDTLSMEAMVGIRISYGTIIDELKGVSRSYKEASMALEVGRVFYGERGVLAYNELGIGRLIHQLPKSLCEMFLSEVLEGNATELFDDEELITVYTFFDNSLNISETARQLFIHRNTLVYRLEKIQKKTGLDVRVFEDALTFKIAVMVERHLKYLDTQ